MREKLEQILAAYEELTARLSDPAVFGDQKEYARLAKEQRAQAPLADKAREYLSVASQLDEAREVMRTESDAEMREFAAEEVTPLGLTVHRHLRAGQVHAHLLRVASGG